MSVYQNTSVTLKNETWTVDEILRQRAEVLVNKYTDQVGHVDLRRVVFARVEGKNAKWLGKCYKIKPPHSLLTGYGVSLMNRLGMLDGQKVESVGSSYDDHFQVEYIIVINEDSLSLVTENKDQVVDILLLHEMMHIDYEMYKLERHDSEDFSWILDTFGVHWASGNIKQAPLTNSDNRIPPNPYDHVTEYVDNETGEVIKAVTPPLPEV